MRKINEEIEGIEEEEHRKDSPPSYQYKAHPLDTSVLLVNQMFKDKAIKIPTYQRDYVWDFKRACRLIESLLVGIPVPPVFVLRDKDGGFKVIDGQQRLTTISYFMKGTYTRAEETQEFRLKEVNEKTSYFKKTFQELEKKDERLFTTAVLRFLIMEASHEDMVPDLFERLNTGGRRLEPQEIRHSIYYSEFDKLLTKLNENQGFKKLLGINIESSYAHRADEEMILRFFSLYDEEYNAVSLKKHLDNYMKSKKNINDDELKDKEKLFKNTCSKILQSIGENPFRSKDKKGTGRVNAAILDCVMIAFAKNLEKKSPRDMRDRYKKLLGKLKPYIKTGTVQKKHINERIKLAQKILFGTTA